MISVCLTKCEFNQPLLQQDQSAATSVRRCKVKQQSSQAADVMTPQLLLWQCRPPTTRSHHVDCIDHR